MTRYGKFFAEVAKRYPNAPRSTHSRARIRLRSTIAAAIKSAVKTSWNVAGWNHTKWPSITRVRGWNGERNSRMP